MNRAAQPVKRGRGRPPKPGGNTVAKKKAEAAAAAGVPKRGRGRPPKVAKNVTATQKPKSPTLSPRKSLSRSPDRAGGSKLVGDSHSSPHSPTRNPAHEEEEAEEEENEEEQNSEGSPAPAEVGQPFILSLIPIIIITYFRRATVRQREAEAVPARTLLAL